MFNEQSEDPEWNDARAIWAAGKVDIPQIRDDDNIHFLSDLKFAASTVVEANRVTGANRERTWSLNDGARLCHQLIEFLWQIDGPVQIRMARASKEEIGPLLDQTLADLSLLGSVLNRTPMPSTPRKRKHEINDMGILRFADIFELGAKANASVTRHWDASTRSGHFVNFVLKFYKLLPPDFTSQISGRSIQASLEKRPTRASTRPQGV